VLAVLYCKTRTVFLGSLCGGLITHVRNSWQSPEYHRQCQETLASCRPTSCSVCWQVYLCVVLRCHGCF